MVIWETDYNQNFLVHFLNVHFFLQFKIHLEIQIKTVLLILIIIIVKPLSFYSKYDIFSLELLVTDLSLFFSLFLKI